MKIEINLLFMILLRKSDSGLLTFLFKDGPMKLILKLKKKYRKSLKDPSSVLLLLSLFKVSLHGKKNSKPSTRKLQQRNNLKSNWLVNNGFWVRKISKYKSRKKSNQMNKTFKNNKKKDKKCMTNHRINSFRWKKSKQQIYNQTICKNDWLLKIDKLD